MERPTDPAPRSPVRLLATIHLKGADLASFERYERYERAVLPLVRVFSGHVEHTVRTLDPLLEVHLLTFPSQESLRAFRDPEPRAAAQDLLLRSGAKVSVREFRPVHYIPTSQGHLRGEA